MEKIKFENKEKVKNEEIISTDRAKGKATGNKGSGGGAQGGGAHLRWHLRWQSHTQIMDSGSTCHLPTTLTGCQGSFQQA